MKKPLFITTADMHLRITNPVYRIDNYKESMINKLIQIKRLQQELDVPVLDTGDVFNGWKSTPATECMAFDYLSSPFITIPGNHEIPFHNMNYLDESSLMVLSKAKRIRLLGDINPTIINKYNIFAVPYGAEMEEISDDYINEGLNVLLTHHMVTKEKDTRFDHITARDMLEKHQWIDVILTGHNHQTFVEEYDGRLLINNGSLMRSSIDQLDHKPCVHIVYDDLSWERIYLDVAPVDKVFNLAHVEMKKKSEEKIENFVSKLKNEYEVGVSFADNIKNYLASNKIRDGVKEVITRAIGE
ncbi:MAG: metallophosphoesterase [Methanogenium sp.]|jgi:predicted phosphodiesterase